MCYYEGLGMCIFKSPAFVAIHFTMGVAVAINYLLLVR